MKKYLLLITLIIFLVALLIASRFKGALPTILPITSPQIEKDSKDNQVKNDLGLKLADGFSIDIFAQNLSAPRDLVFDSGGTLLTSIPSKGKVVALPDTDGDGKADKVIEIVTNMNRPHGLAFFEDRLYIVEETQVSSYHYDIQNLTASPDRVLFDLPKGGRHVTRTIAFKDNGAMFISIGSTCDVCFEKHPLLATIIFSDKDGKTPQVFAKGLRNSVFITVDPNTQKLWATEMGRDFLGDNEPSDEINIIEKDKDYGWPNCFGNKIADTRFNKSANQKTCENTQPPTYEICAHCAPLGLTFIQSAKFPKGWQDDLLVAYHGSWNSSNPVGYKVVRLNVEGEKIIDEVDFLSDFLKGNQTQGRPVDLVFDKNGNLFISDDKAGLIYRIYK